jgi:hypothetical protein
VERAGYQISGAMAAGPPSPPPLHPVLQPVSCLLGTWRGEGEGGYPTIQSFKYGEEIKLWHSGKVLSISDSQSVVFCATGVVNLLGIWHFFGGLCILSWRLGLL